MVVREKVLFSTSTRFSTVAGTPKQAGCVPAQHFFRSFSKRLASVPAQRVPVSHKTNATDSKALRRRPHRSSWSCRSSFKTAQIFLRPHRFSWNVLQVWRSSAPFPRGWLVFQFHAFQFRWPFFTQTGWLASVPVQRVPATVENRVARGRE